jgi:hypothetical protein
MYLPGKDRRFVRAIMQPSLSTQAQHERGGTATILMLCALDYNFACGLINNYLDGCDLDLTNPFPQSILSYRDQWFDGKPTPLLQPLEYGQPIHVIIPDISTFYTYAVSKTSSKSYPS